MTAPRPLRIVHVSSVHPATDSRIFEKECQTLAAQGHSVTLVATGEPPSITGPVRVITRTRFQRRMTRILLGPAWAIWQAMKLKPDVIHMHDPELIPLGIILSLTRIRVVYDAHEDLIEQIQHKHYMNPTIRRIAGKLSLNLMKSVDRRFDAIIGATAHITARFPHALSATVQNFPIANSFDTASESAINSKRIVYVGGISEARGLRQMIEATRLLSPTGVVLHLAGPQHGDVAEIINDAQREGLVVYHGILTREEVASLLSSSAVGLAVLHPVPNYINGKPTKLYEYMAAGIPVVASDFPLWREMVIEPAVGLVVDPMSPQAIAGAVSDILNSPHNAKSMGRNGRSWVESHRNWASEGKALVSLYESLAH